MRHHNTASWIAVALVVVLAACDTDEPGGATTTDPPSTATSTEPATTDGDPVVVYDLPDTVAFPEGIAVDTSTGRIYVGNTTDGAVHRSVTDDPADGFEIFLPADDERDQLVGMDVRGGLLFAAGRRNATLHVHDIDTGDEIATLTTPDTDRTLLNDITFDAEHAYVTDSFRPVIFRVALDDLETATELDPWLDLTTTPLAYTDGFNLNGITASDDGTVLLTVQSNTGALWRIDTTTRNVTEVELDDGDVTTGDGLVLDGTTLYTVTNRPAALIRIELDDQLASGNRTDILTDDSLDLPTTVAESGGNLYVVNSQLDDPAGEETLPFTITRFPFEP